MTNRTCSMKRMRMNLFPKGEIIIKKDIIMKKAKNIETLRGTITESKN